MKHLKWAGIALGAVPGLCLLWGVAIEPRRLERTEILAPIPHLPPCWEGQRVAMVSDVQVGMWLANTDTIQRLVARLVRERPALVLIAGDFVYEAAPGPAAEIEQVVALIRPLTAAGIPTYAVLGNHDYAATPDDQPGERDAAGARVAGALRAALAGIGVTVLHNQAVALPPPRVPAADGPPLYLVGLGAHEPGEDAPAAAVAQVPPAPRLVFMHHPASFAALPPNSAPVALAGHTHGGQVRVPFHPAWNGWALLGSLDIPPAGWIAGYGEPGNHLYITRGIGFSVAPIRFNCPPELTMLRLTGNPA